jgi:hypothetical protein
MDWGEHAEKIKAAALEALGMVPSLPFLENEPELADHLAFEFGAFNDLSRDRDVGFGLGPIPWCAMDAYARRLDLVGDDFDRFVLILSKVDDAFRQHCEEKNEAKNEANSKQRR